MELSTARLILRPAGEGDLDFYFELRNREERGFGAWTVFDRKTDERLGRVELDPMGSGSAGLVHCSFGAVPLSKLHWRPTVHVRCFVPACLTTIA
jgi:hypothetical protein